MLEPKNADSRRIHKRESNTAEIILLVMFFHFMNKYTIEMYTIYIYKLDTEIHRWMEE